MPASVRKIAFILPNFQAGGAERVMITVANHLDRQLFQPIIVVFDNHGALRDLIAPDVPIINLSVAHISLGTIVLARAVREQGIDLVISTMAHLNICVLLARPFMPGVPVVVREAVTPSYFSDNVLKRFILRVAYTCLYPFATRILSPTQLVFDEMPKILRRQSQKLRRIFNPVNTDIIGQSIDLALRSKWAHSGQRLFVGAGRLVGQKGFDRLIKSLKEWRTRDDWRLIILGEGPDHDELQNLITENELHQIVLAGFESNPWRYFAIADAFVLPSRHEGLPNVALEALALGVPVIAAASAGGIGEIAQVAGGQSVKIAHDMDEFTKFMDMVFPYVGDRPRVSLLPQCFSLPHVVASYEQLFTEVLCKD